MVYISADIEISATVAEKSRNTFCRKVNLTTYIVKPRYHGKTRRLITFNVRPGNALTATCVDLHDPKNYCEANRFGRPCYHLIAAMRRLEINSRRQQKRAA